MGKFVSLLAILAVCGGVKGKTRYSRALPQQGEVTVYMHENYQGASESYIIYKICENIDPSYIGHISSLYPAKGTCVQVFRDKDCPESETSVKLWEHDYGTDNLARIDLDDQIQSIKLC